MTQLLQTSMSQCRRCAKYSGGVLSTYGKRRGKPCGSDSECVPVNHRRLPPERHRCAKPRGGVLSIYGYGSHFDLACAAAAIHSAPRSVFRQTCNRCWQRGSDCCASIRHGRAAICFAIFRGILQYSRPVPGRLKGREITLSKIV